jgi:hypothetical protein
MPVKKVSGKNIRELFDEAINDINLQIPDHE